jgi:putative membrane protein
MAGTDRTQHDGGVTLLTIGWGVALLASGWQPYDRTTWWMEVAPALCVLSILWMTKRRFTLTRLALLLIFLHGLVLMMGGAYTYARVPLGFEVQHWLRLMRNPYDRFGHLMQGFVPAIVLRELLIRLDGLRSGSLLTTLVVACCLAISASYELIEFAAAMALGQGADEFLGTQGDAWDTQWDMLMCLIGAVTATTALSGIHDRRIADLTGQPQIKTKASGVADSATSVNCLEGSKTAASG